MVIDFKVQGKKRVESCPEIEHRDAKNAKVKSYKKRAKCMIMTGISIKKIPGELLKHPGFRYIILL